MKALILGFHIDRNGGIESVTLDIAHALRASGYDVQLWSVMDAGVRDIEGLRVVGFSPTRGLPRRVYARTYGCVLGAALVAYARDVELCVVVHAFLTAPVVRVRRLGLIKSKVLVWTHGLEVWGDMARKIARHAKSIDRVVAVSEYTASHLSPLIPKEKVRVIPNAVSVEQFAVGPESQVSRDELLIVGRLSREERYKGHEHLLRALVILHGRGIAIRLTVIGDGDDRCRLEQLTHEMGLDEYVVFRGRVSRKDLVEAYQRCLAFVMPSFVATSPSGFWKGEGFGLVYIEAAACGRPVIASAEGGAPETILDGETGFIVNPRDPEDIANKIQILWADQKTAHDMGRRGRLLVEKKFSITVFRENVQKLLHDLQANGQASVAPVDSV